MNELRIKYKNKSHLDIKQAELLLKRNNETIGRFLNMTEHTDFYRQKIDKLKQENIISIDTITTLKQKIKDIDGKKIDDLLVIEENEAIKQAQQTQHTKPRAPASVNMMKNRQENQPKHTRKYYNDQPRTDFIDREYKYYLSRCDSLPSYISQNLSSMSNNKGYIHNGVWFFGAEKANGTTIYMTENKKGVSYYHEINRDSYILKERYKDSKTNILFKEKRKPVLNDAELMEIKYLK